MVADNQAGLNQKLNFTATGLQDGDKCRQQLHNITLPLEVSKYIDRGWNSQPYMEGCSERSQLKMNKLKAKLTQ